VLSDDTVKTRLIAFSDDMDGLTQSPRQTSEQGIVAQHLAAADQGADPFGTHDSFAPTTTRGWRAFLDQFGFDYEFMSSTECYTSGKFDAALLKVLERFDAVNEHHAAVAARGAGGILFAVPADSHRAPASCCKFPWLRTTPKAGTITYEDPDSKERVTTLVTGGRCKLHGSRTGRCAGSRSASITRWPARI